MCDYGGPLMAMFAIDNWNKTIDDYAEYFHDVPNVLLLNKNIDDYSCDFHLCVYFFFQVINLGVQRNTFTWQFSITYLFINYNLILLTLFKYLFIFLAYFFPKRLYSLIYTMFFQCVLCGP